VEEAIRVEMTARSAIRLTVFLSLVAVGATQPARPPGAPHGVDVPAAPTVNPALPSTSIPAKASSTSKPTSDPAAVKDTSTPNTGGGDSTTNASMVIFVCGFIGLAFAYYLFSQVSQISLDTQASSEDGKGLREISDDEKNSDEELKAIYEVIREGAKSFLWAEYRICFIFLAGFGFLVLVLTSHVSDEAGKGVWKWNIGSKTAFSFLVGGGTSILSGYIGMMVAVFLVF
jgi:inorganic pyrophosphatase